MTSMFNGEIDISDSEINEYKEIAYKLLKFRPQRIRGTDGKFRCPFCANQKENDYEYTHLLQHAIGVAEGSTVSAKQRADHLAMAAYLETDVSREAEPLHQNTMPSPAYDRDFDTIAPKISKASKKPSGACGDDEDNSGDPSGDYLSRRAALKTLSDDFVNTLETETRKLKLVANHHVKQILEEQETLILELKSKKQQLDCQSRELDKREASLTESARQNMKFGKIKNDKKDPMFHEAATYLEEDAEENCFLREIERLKAREIEISLIEREHQALVIKERVTYDELQDARKVLIKFLNDTPSQSCATIGVKRMGEIDVKAFKNACEKIFPANQADGKTAELFSLWQGKLKDPFYCPFKAIKNSRGITEMILDVNDESLGHLKMFWSLQVYDIVAGALLELHDFNPSGRYMDCELWNFKENRKAMLGEAISTILTQLRTTG